MLTKIRFFKHVRQTGYLIKWESTWITDRDPHEGRRLTKEGVAIKFGPNIMENNVNNYMSEVQRTLASRFAPIHGKIK